MRKKRYNRGTLIQKMLMKKLFVVLFAVLFLASCGANSDTPSNTGSNTASSGSEESVNSSVDGDAEKAPADTPSPTYGAGEHKLEVFADFQCPACINASKTLDPTFNAYAETGKLLIEYRQFPLTSIHKNAYRDALAGLCAADQGKYVEYKKELYSMEEKKRGGSVSDSERIALASNVAIDTEVFAACLSSDKYKAKVDADMAYGDRLGVTGTPTYVLDGKKLDMGQIGSIENLAKVLDAVTGQSTTVQPVVEEKAELSDEIKAE